MPEYLSYKEQVVVDMTVRKTVIDVLRSLGAEAESLAKKGAQPRKTADDLKQVTEHSNKATESIKMIAGGLSTVGSALSLVGLGVGFAAGATALTVNALRKISVTSLNLHYAAKEMGMMPKEFVELRQGLMRLGMGQDEATSTLAQFGDKMRDMAARGPASKVYQEFGSFGEGSMQLRDKLIDIYKTTGSTKGALIAYAEAMLRANAYQRRQMSIVSGLPERVSDLQKVLGRYRTELILDERESFEFNNNWIDLQVIFGNLTTAIKGGLIKGLNAYHDKLKETGDIKVFNEEMSKIGQDFLKFVDIIIKYKGGPFREEPSDSYKRSRWLRYWRFMHDYEEARKAEEWRQRNFPEEGYELGPFKFFPKTEVPPKPEEPEWPWPENNGPNPYLWKQSYQPEAEGQRIVGGGRFRLAIPGGDQNAVQSVAIRIRSDMRELTDLKKEDNKVLSEIHIALSGGGGLYGGGGGFGWRMSPTGQPYGQTSPDFPVDQSGKPVDNETVTGLRALAARGDTRGMQNYMLQRGYRVDNAWCGDLARAFVQGSGYAPPKGYPIASTWRTWGQNIDPSGINEEGRPFGSIVASKTNVPIGSTGGHVMTIIPGTYDPRTNTAVVADTHGQVRRSLRGFEVRYAGDEAVKIAKERQSGGTGVAGSQGKSIWDQKPMDLKSLDRSLGRQARAKVNLNVKGPPGTRVEADGEGIFTDGVKINRSIVRQMEV